MKKTLLLLMAFITSIVVDAQVTGAQSYSQIFDGVSTNNWVSDRSGSASVSDGHFIRTGASDTSRSDIAYNLAAGGANESDPTIEANVLTFDTSLDKYIALKFIGSGPTGSLQALRYSADGGWTGKPSPTGTYTTAAGNEIQYFDLANLLGSGYDPENNLTFKVRRFQLINTGLATDPDYVVDWIATFASVEDIEANATVADDGVDDNDEEVLSIEDVELSGLAIYPNPAKDFVSIENKQLLNAELTVYDLNGRTLLNKIINSSEAKVDISAFPSGLYIFKVASDAGDFVKRIMKQ